MDDSIKPKMRNQLAIFAVLVLLLMLAASSAVSAASRIGGALSGAGTRVGGALQGWLTAETPGVFDFVIFGIMFFAICWIGFQKWFESAKGAAIALSVTLAIALAGALVFGGKVGVKKLLPFASLLLFILVWVGIAFILQKLLFRSESTLSKLLAFGVAFILTFIILGFTLSSLCGSEGCSKNPLLADLVGKTSVFGRITGWFDDLFNGPSGPSGPTPGTPPGPAPKGVDETLYNTANAFANNPSQEPDDLKRAERAQGYITSLKQ